MRFPNISKYYSINFWLYSSIAISLGSLLTYLIFDGHFICLPTIIFYFIFSIIIIYNIPFIIIINLIFIIIETTLIKKTQKISTTKKLQRILFSTALLLTIINLIYWYFTYYKGILNNPELIFD